MARVANTGIPSPALSDGTPAGGTFYKPAYEVTPPLHQGYVHANGFITPVASPVKSGFVDSDLGFDTPVQMIDKHRVTQLSTPPPEPVSRSSAAGATSKHKKEERQTRISDHLTASKPSAAAPKGKPKKGAAQAKQGKAAASKKIKADLLNKLESSGLDPTKEQLDQLVLRPGVAELSTYDLTLIFENMVAQDKAPPMSSSASSARNAAIHATPQQTPPSLKRKASDLSFSTPPPSKTSRIRGTQATATRGPLEIKVRMPVTMPPSPPLSEGEAPTDLVRSISPPPPSPDLCSSSPELSKLALYIDEATGEANLSASSPNSASLPSLSYGSSSASSSDSFGSFGSMSNTSGVTGPSSYVVKANVPGIGRCIFQRSVLLAKLGEEAAHKAISAAEALTLRRSPLFDGKPGLWRTGSLDSSRNGTPAPVVGAAVRSAELVRRWLEQDKDGEEVEEATLRQGTFFLPGQAYPSMDDEEDWYAKEDSEDFVVSQGGKSIRVLRKRNKDLNDPSRPRSRTSSNRSGKHGGDGAVTCVCKQPDQDCDMVQCDSCRGWFHLHCLEIASIDDIPQDRDWFCYRCSGGPMPHVRVSSFKNRRPLNYHPLPDWHNQPTGIPCPPMLVQSSPHIPRAASFGLFNPHLTLHGSNPATPLQSGQQSHTRSDKRSTHLWYQSQTPYSGRPDPASYVSYSPKTPAVGSVVEPRSRIPSFNLDSYYNDEALIGTEGYLGNGWHNPCGMQTPSRSAGVSLAHDWSYPMPTSFKRNTSASSAHQDFFQKLHTATPKQHVTFESPSAGSPLPNRSTHQRVRSGQSHLSNSPFLGQPHPRHSAIKLAPPAMARAGSGLGIGFGDGGLF